MHKVVSEGVDLYEAIDKLLDYSDIEIYDTKSGILLYDSKMKIIRRKLCQ